MHLLKRVVSFLYEEGTWKVEEDEEEEVDEQEPNCVAMQCNLLDRTKLKIFVEIILSIYINIFTH